jgi:general secretion pathway protein E
MITLYEDGLRKVLKGLTSLEEVMRVTQDQSEGDASLEAVQVDTSLDEAALV